MVPPFQKSAMKYFSSFMRLNIRLYMSKRCWAVGIRSIEARPIGISWKIQK